jgi:phage N-6-adenine-methyltransferase
MKCQLCRKAFKPTRSDARTCSAACRQMAYRRRMGVTARNLAKRNFQRPVRRPRSVHFSSATDVYSTPQDLFDELHEEFGFTLDVCALPENAKCPSFYTPAENGLAQPWRGVCWMNPPYGRTIGQWMRKAAEAVKQGATVVALVPARTDTRWWHDYVVPAHEVRYLKGRLKFGGAEHCAPFPSAIVVMKPPGRPARRRARPRHRGLIGGGP